MARSLGLLRVVDESGDDYLYPTSRFGQINLPQRIATAITAGRSRS